MAVLVDFLRPPCNLELGEIWLVVRTTEILAG